MARLLKLKTNRIIYELIDFDCISVYKNKKGKYKIVDKGLRVLNLM